MNCSTTYAALTTLACHADMFRHVGVTGLVLYAPLVIPVGLAVAAIGAMRGKRKSAPYNSGRVTARHVGRLSVVLACLVCLSAPSFARGSGHHSTSHVTSRGTGTHATLHFTAHHAANSHVGGF